MDGKVCRECIRKNVTPHQTAVYHELCRSHWKIHDFPQYQHSLTDKLNAASFLKR